MARPNMTVERQSTVLRAARGKGKTKAELADAVGLGNSYVSRIVNDLVASGRLKIVGTFKPSRGRPAPRYGVPR